MILHSSHQWLFNTNQEYNKNDKEHNRKKRWYENHPEYFKNSRKRLDSMMGTTICIALKGKKIGRQWKKLVGYSLNDLIRHLENQFSNKMGWNNWGKHWEIDHKIPKSWFNYDTAEDEEFKKCWALDNLQPLEKELNRFKNNKFRS